MPKRKQTKITRSAKGEECLTRIPSVCNWNPETTVFAHKNGGGMAIKVPDYHGSFACSDCHAWLDGGYVKTHTRAQRDLLHAEAIFRTQDVLFDKGLLVVA